MTEGAVTREPAAAAAEQEAERPAAAGLQAAAERSSPGGDSVCAAPDEQQAASEPCSPDAEAECLVMSELRVTAEQNEGRLDAFLARLYPDLTRSYLRKAILEGAFLLNGSQAKAGAAVKEGDTVTGCIPEPKKISAEPQNIPLDVFYEDRDLLVVNKPRGMVTHPAAGTPDGTLVNALLYHTKDLSGIAGELRPGIIHRLDKDTSGLLVIAKNDRSHQALSAELQARHFEKRYLALVEGNVVQDEGTITQPIGRSRRDYRKMAVRPNGREAVTHYRVLERFGRYTLLEITIETGRTHQIRVHMLHMGHPVAGDPLYGKEDPLHLEGQFLHARRLCFDHPSTGERMCFEAPLPEKLQEVLDQLRRRIGTRQDDGVADEAQTLPAPNGTPDETAAAVQQTDEA